MLQVITQTSDKYTIYISVSRTDKLEKNVNLLKVISKSDSQLGDSVPLRKVHLFVLYMLKVQRAENPFPQIVIVGEAWYPVTTNFSRPQRKKRPSSKPLNGRALKILSLRCKRKFVMCLPPIRA